MAPLSAKEQAALAAGPAWAHLPNFLTIDDVASVLRVPKHTVYAWSSQGALDKCKVRVGKYVRFVREKFIELVISGGLSSE